MPDPVHDPKDWARLKALCMQLGDLDRLKELRKSANRIWLKEHSRAYDEMHDLEHLEADMRAAGEADDHVEMILLTLIMELQDQIEELKQHQEKEKKGTWHDTKTP